MSSEPGQIGNKLLGREKQAAIEMVSRHHRRMGKQMIRKFSGRFFNALVLVLALMIAVPWAAFAETVDSDIVTSGANGTNIAYTAGDANGIDVKYWIENNNTNSPCEPATGDNATVKLQATRIDVNPAVDASAVIKAKLVPDTSPTSLAELSTFTFDVNKCGNSSTNTKTINFSTTSNAAAGKYKIVVSSVTDTGALESYTGAAEFHMSISAPTNQAPVADAQSVTTNEDTAKNIALGASDPDGNSLTYTVVSGPTNGALSGSGATRTYTPAANYNGPDSFTFKVNDGTVDSNTATVSITVNAVNDAPVAVDDVATTVEDTAATVNVLANDTDVEGSSLSVTAVSGATNGTAVLNSDGTVTFTPAANFYGTAGFNYTLSDGSATDTGHVSITVSGVNDAPVAVDDTANGTEDMTSYIDALVNDSDVDGDTLRVSDISIDVGNDAKADVSIVRAGDPDAQDNVGKVRFVPAENFNGSVAFGYTASDGSLTDTANVTVDIAAVNDLPTATVALSPASPRTNQTLTATVTRSDVDGDAVSLRYVWKNGTMVVRDVTKSAGASADLTDSLDLSVAGNGDKGDTITVEVTPNDGTANGDVASDSETVADTAPEAGTASISPSPAYRGSTLTAEGESTWSDADGDTISYTYQWFKYNPAAQEFEAISGATGEAYNGTLTKGEQYQVRITGTADGASASDTSDALTISNSAPVADAGADITNASEGASVSFDGSGSGDVDGDALEYSWNFGDGSAATAFSTSATASHSYADGPNQYTVTLTVRDGDGGTHTDTLAIAVNNVAPTASFSAPDVNEGSNIVISLTDADDASSADNAAGFRYSFDCGSGYSAWGAGNSASCTTNDNGSRTVRGQIKDKDGGVREYAASVTVNNVAPTTSNPVFTFNPVTREAKASFDFSDVGTADTHTASFAWSVNGTATVRTGAVVETNGTGAASDTLVLPVGCYTLTVIGTVADDDGASTEQSIVSGRQADAYKASFKAPIMDNARNIAKYGNVVPVKVLLESQCAPGTTVTDQSLYITLAKGVNGEFIEDTVTVAESVSAADSGSQMRIADGMYIYNLTTKNLTANADYAVRIRLGSTTGPVILQAVIYPKK